MALSTHKYLKVFTVGAARALAPAFKKRLPAGCMGTLNTESFSNGETYVQVGESVRGCNCFVVATAARDPNQDIMELLLTIDALKRSLAKYIHVVIPHFFYARQDRIAESREPISAKLVANIIESAGAKHAICLDLHWRPNTSLFRKTCRPPKRPAGVCPSFFKKKLKRPVVVSPDAGGAKKAEKFAKLIGADLAVLHKSRPGHNKAKVVALAGDVSGRSVILFDDMVDTAGSVCAAAELLKKNNAGDMYLAATHAVLSGKALELLEKSPFKEIVFTDSVPHAFKGALKKKIVVCSVVPMLADTLRGLHEGRSISGIWEGHA